jgi:hypothetical protein
MFELTLDEELILSSNLMASEARGPMRKALHSASTAIVQQRARLTRRDIVHPTGR